MRATNPFGGRRQATRRAQSRRRGRPRLPGRRPPSQLAAAAALAATLALAAAIVVFAAVLLLTPHSERLEAIWWLAGFGVVAPLAVLGGGTPAGRCGNACRAGAALTAAAPAALLALVRSCSRSARAAGSPPLVAAVQRAALRCSCPCSGSAGSQRWPGAPTLAPWQPRPLAAAGALGVAAFLPRARTAPT